MAYFCNVHSLADLKEECRRLVLQHHPDKGGDTVVMQQVNTEFERLFEVWRDRPDASVVPTGYEHDYPGATVRKYTEYVYNEYRWRDRNCKGQHAPEIVELVRIWLKEAYPRYKFSVRRENYNSIYIKLMGVDFEMLTRESGKVQDHINHHNIERNPGLTDRAKEVMLDVCDFVMSCNFGDSDAMMNYFHINFYLTLAIGSYRKPYKVELSKLDYKGKDEPEAFKHPKGPAYKAIRQTLGTARFDFIEHRRHSGEMILGEDYYGSRGEHYFWPKDYSNAKLVQRRIDKLKKAGIRCKLTGHDGGYTHFIGYTPEAEALLEKERQEYIIAHRQW